MSRNLLNARRAMKNSKSKKLSINEARLWESLMEMAKVGATEKGGNCRLALSTEDKNGRDLFVKWSTEAGCDISIDEVGNIFALRKGKQKNGPIIMTGSHLDTQPTGGRFDGVLGVLAGLEVIKTLNENNIRTDFPLEVVCWTNEEGSRFSPAMMGSGTFVNKFNLKEVLAKKDITGLTFGDELRRIGYAGCRPLNEKKIQAYFELHIEQGPLLEERNKTIGVVTGAQGQRWHEITIIGRESHAGPTPMHLRQDALVEASKIIQEVNRIGNKYQPGACATVGLIEISPNSRNVIPGQAFITTDLRHPDDKILLQMDQDMKNFCQQLQTKSNIKIEIEDLWFSPPIQFDKNCITLVESGAKFHDYTFCNMVSGAGHDAVYLARIAPTGMIFIPCENGISHNEIENASSADCAAGTNVLLHSILNT